MSDAEFPQSSDEALERFEKAWASGNSPDIKEFLLTSKPLQDQSSLLADLIELDLEYRWKRFSDTLSTDGADEQPSCPSLVDYESRFAGLSDDEAVAERLLIHEYRVRQRWGDRPTVDQLLDPNSSVISPELMRRLAVQLQHEEKLRVAPSDVASGESQVSKRIGPYKILQKIAEGGMGAVFMAEQEDPVRRRVALKLIKAGADSDQIIARFEAERQALAMMDHPNIARVFDGGTTDGGSPYFVMELVKGIPLTDYCDNNRLSIRERLELFVSICKAVQHAHLKGIIHRDLKPSNVLVALHDGVPVPKVIDFGLAKAMDHRTKLTDKTLFTEFGQVVGTLQYMSPEQAEMNQLEVDTRTDVYSLGVMLYELLTGSTPLERATVGKNALLAVLAMIRDQEPPRPSTRLSESGDAINGVSDHRKIGPSQLQQILRGELDWIVMRSLERDRVRRYETANAVANDVTRYLNDEQVHARPPSFGYRLQKTFRRYKAFVVTLGLIIGLLVAGLAGTGTMWIRASRETLRANNETKRANGETANARATQKKERLARIEVEAERDKVRVERNRVLAAREETDEALSRANFLLAKARWNTHRVAEARGYLNKVAAKHRSLEWYLAKRQFRGSDFTCYGHWQGVADVSCSSDGRTIVSVGRDGSIRWWDATDGREIGIVRVGTPTVGWTSVRFSPDNRIIAVGTTDRTVQLFEANTGKVFRTIKTQAKVTSVSFSPDGKLICAGMDGNTLIDNLMVLSGNAPIFGRGTGIVALWSTDTGERIGKAMHHEKAGISAVAFSPDGAVVATADSLGEVKLWDVKSGEEQNAMQRGSDIFVSSICFSPDSSRLVVGHGDDDDLFGEIIFGTARVLDTRTGTKLLELDADHREVERIAMSPDGTLVATGNSDGTIRLWNLQTEAIIRTLAGHSDAITGLQFTPDGARLISGSADQSVRMWNFHDSFGDSYTVRDFAEIPDVTISDDGLTLEVVDDSGTVKHWDILSRQWMVSFPNQAATSFTATSNDSKTYARTVDGDQTVYCRGAKTGRLEWSVQSHVSGFDVSKDRSRLVTVGQENVVWDTTTRRKLQTLPKRSDYEHLVKFSPDGKNVAISGDSGTIRLYEAKSGTELWNFTVDSGFPSMQFSEDGSRIVVEAMLGSAVKILNAKSGEEVESFAANAGLILAVRLTDIGLVIVHTHEHETREAYAIGVSLLPVAPSDDVITLRGHTNSVSSINFNQNQSLLQSRSKSEALTWDVATGVLREDGAVDFQAHDHDGKLPRRWQAVPAGNDVLLVDTLFKDRPFERALLESKARIRPGRHRDQATNAKANKDWFAAAFHFAWLVRREPDKEANKADFAEAFARLQDDYDDRSEELSPILPEVIREAVARARAAH